MCQCRACREIRARGATLYVDGGCHGNGQLDTTKRSMIALVSDKDGGVLVDRHYQGWGSNNIAELLAVQHALEWCAQHAVERVEIITDSRNNLSWVGGRGACRKNPFVAPILADIDELRKLVSFELKWVPREQNKAGHRIEEIYSL